MNNLHEECGIFGICRKDLGDVALDSYLGLFALQHRGQESCGIAVNNDGLFSLFVDAGLVNEAITENHLNAFSQGSMAIGHVRYGSEDERGRINAQPIVVDHMKGRMALANNGSLVNYNELRRQYEAQGSIFHTTSDAEVISCAITRERLTAPSLEESVNRAMKLFKGSYSLVIMTPKKLIAVRDPLGFKPLCYGKKKDGSFVVASESCAIDAVGAELVRDIKPGEIIIFDRDQTRSINDNIKGDKAARLCAFEYIYFARPDSVIDGVSVHEARLKMGEILSKEHPVDADIVVGVPDSGIDAAIGYSRASGIPYGLGFIKSRYIARTFIAPKQVLRERGVRIKLNPIVEAVKGKRVILIDDSIVRGTTSQKIVALIREAGAKEVHMRITAPPFQNPCYYGTDIKSRDVLIACKYSIVETARHIGADSLAYLSVQGLNEITGNKGLSMCKACFNGDYPTQAPESTERNRFGKRLMRIGGTE